MVVHDNISVQLQRFCLTKIGTTVTSFDGGMRIYNRKAVWIKKLLCSACFAAVAACAHVKSMTGIATRVETNLWEGYMQYKTTTHVLLCTLDPS
jgi:hypothetical protein